MDFNINNPDFLNILVKFLTLCLSILMIIFNTLLIYVLLYKLDLKSTELRLILFLSGMELLFGAQIIILSISKLVYGYHIMDPNNLNCQVHGTFSTFIMRNQIIFVTVLALWRYLLVIYNIELKFFIWIGIVVEIGLAILVIVLYGALSQTMKPSSSYLVCVPFSVSGLSNFVFNVILTLMNAFPCWATTFFYFSIGLKVNKRLNELKVEAKETNDLEAFRIISRQKFKLILQLILVFILYNVDFMFSYVSFILRLAIGYKRSPSFDALVYFAYFFSIVATPVVTISFQPDTSNELKIIFVKLEAKVKELYNGMFNRE